MKKISLLFVLLLSIWGCSNDESFSTPATGTDFTTDAVQAFTYERCALNGSVNPPVDVLVLIDNSTSTNLIDRNLREAILNSIQTISQDFDYRIYVAPLLQPNTGDQFSNYPRFSGRPSGSTPLSPLSQVEAIEGLTFNAPRTGGQELGFQRSIEIINRLHDTNDLNFFRKNTHDVIIVISNGDDSDGQVGINQFSSNFTLRQQELLAQRTANQTQQLRFVSIVPHSDCRQGFQRGRLYQRMSKELYNLSGDRAQQSRSFPDSYDLCTGNIANVFSDINTSIQPTVENLTYHYWPVENELRDRIVDNTVNLDRLQLFKVEGEAINEVDKSLYTYQPTFTGNLVEPSHITDIPWDGAVLDLEPAAFPVSPSCLIISAPDRPRFFGFVRMAVPPRVNSIRLTVNGRIIPEDATNGWQFVGFQDSMNVLVQSPTDTSPSRIWNDFQSGYFIRLNGNAIYSDGDQVNLRFNKAPLRDPDKK